jgi:transcription termination factor Rho
MNLSEIKLLPITELTKMAKNKGLDNVARMRKQDILFAILKGHAKSGEDIFGDGVLEILPDGFGFLRNANSSYLAGPDDIMFRRVKLGVLVYEQAILFLEKFVLLSTVNVILLYLK